MTEGTYLLTFVIFSLLAQGQLYDCPSAIGVTLKYIEKKTGNKSKQNTTKRDPIA